MKLDEKEKEKIFNAEIGALIRELRDKREWTQEELAEKAALSVKTISEVERGNSGLGTYSFFKICEALDTDSNRLLRLDVDIRDDELRHHYIEMSKLEPEKREIVISTIKFMLRELDNGIAKVK